MILVCIFNPWKALVSSAVHRVAGESCKKRGVRSQNPGARSPWSAASLARPTGRGPGRARLPNDGTILPKVTGSEGLLRVATPRRLPSRGSMAVFSLYTVAHPRPAARRVYRPNAALGVQIISWRWFWPGAIREPRPTNGLRPIGLVPAAAGSNAPRGGAPLLAPRF
jgi:hypothetical protein